MGVCKFKTEEIKGCIQHSMQNGKNEIVLVHDQGIYCMTAGKRTDDEVKGGAYICYAQGCNPKVDEDFYDEASYLVGGDDFAERITFGPNWLANCDAFEVMEIRVNTRSMSIVFKKPKKTLKKAV